MFSKIVERNLQVRGLISARFWSSLDFRDDHRSDESGGGGGCSSLNLLRCVAFALRWALAFVFEKAGFLECQPSSPSGHGHGPRFLPRE